jgi:hypothetical protein
MAFPAPSLTPPTLSYGQWSYRGITFGGIVKGASFQLVSATGIDQAAMSSGDVARPEDQGEFKGLDTLSGVDITVSHLVTANTGGAPITPAAAGAILEPLRQAMGAMMIPTGSTEYPLYVQMAGGIYARMARPRKHNFPWDIQSFLAGGTPVSSLWHATDPRWYAQPSKSATVSVPSPLGGMTFPATFPLSFGGGDAGGMLSVYNNGTIEMRPQFVITGPCSDPSISNLSIAGSPVIQVGINLNVGDTLTIETDFQSILYRAAGTTVATSRANLLASGSTWFNLLPASGPEGIGGPNVLQFLCSSSAATCAVQSADAYASL